MKHVIPYVTDATNSDVAVTVGEKLSLRCTQNVDVKATWYKNDEALQRLTTKIRLSKQSLKIKYVEAEDAGVYGCKLESNDTVEWRNVTVRVETPQNDGFQDGGEEPINVLRTEEESNDLEIESRSKFNRQNLLVNVNQTQRLNIALN